MNAVDELVMAKVGLSVRDLPVLDFYDDAYEAGVTPTQFFNEAVLHELQDLGADEELLETIAIRDDLRERYLRATGDSF